MGNLQFELAMLATRRYLLKFLLMFEVWHSNIGSQNLRLMVARVSLFQVAEEPTSRLYAPKFHFTFSVALKHERLCYKTIDSTN